MTTGALCRDRSLRLTLSHGRPTPVSDVLAVGVVVMTPDSDLDTVRSVLERGREAGASRLIVDQSGRRGARAAGNLHAVCELTGPLELLAGVKFMPYSATPTLSAAGRLTANVGDAHARVVLDVLHVFRSGGTVADVEAPRGEELQHLVQLCDAPLTALPYDRLREEALGERHGSEKGNCPCGGC